MSENQGGVGGRSLAEIEDFLAGAISSLTNGKVQADRIPRDVDFVDHLDLDSLFFAELMIEVEGWLELRFDEAAIDWEEFTSIQALAKALHDHQPRRAGG